MSNNEIKESGKYHILSFKILDDLNTVVSHSYKYKRARAIKNIVTKIWKDIMKEDPTGFFFRSNMETKIKEIVESLKLNKYCVYNRVEKYYVILFSIDYTPVKIWSKDCDPIII